MPSEPMALVNIAELRIEAAEARCLASQFKDRETVGDLLSYAAALEFDANRYEQALSQRESVLVSDNSRRRMWTNRLLAGAQH